MNNWESELEKGIPPHTFHGIQLSPAELGVTGIVKKIDVYDPWQDSWTSIKSQGSDFTLPDFKRSIVVRINKTH
jgi:hypothetical protein